MIGLQVKELHPAYDQLQAVYGDTSLMPIYGAGRINNPQFMFVFMNPTGRNISAQPTWRGIRAPWIGTKNVWGMFEKLGIVPTDLWKETQLRKREEWTADLAQALYLALANSSVFVTNLAKCTQLDARHLSDAVFHEYRKQFIRELEIVQPRYVITFGNQVSSVLLRKNVSVSSYPGALSEILTLDAGGSFDVYPTFYPVGQGRRNMPLAISRIQCLQNRAQFG